MINLTVKFFIILMAISLIVLYSPNVFANQEFNTVEAHRVGRYYLDGEEINDINVLFDWADSIDEKRFFLEHRIPNQNTWETSIEYEKRKNEFIQNEQKEVENLINIFDRKQIRYVLESGANLSPKGGTKFSIDMTFDVFGGIKFSEYGIFNKVIYLNPKYFREFKSMSKTAFYFKSDLVKFRTLVPQSRFIQTEFTGPITGEIPQGCYHNPCGLRVNDRKCTVRVYIKKTGEELIVLQRNDRP